MNSIPLKHPSRNLAIDGFRGWLLILIAINHLEGPLISPFTRESFGFVSAAEAFIFLSGFVASLVYGRLIEQPKTLFKRIYARTFTLYLFTLGGVGIITALLHGQLLPDYWYQDQQGYFLLENYLNYPIQSLVLSALQLQQMGYFDILIAYIVPMLWLPLALLALASGRGYWLILASVGLWLASQFISDQPLAGIYQLAHSNMNIEAGYLDVFAWQLLFFSGVVAAYCYRYKHWQAPRWHSPAGLTLLTMALLFAAVKHSPSAITLALQFTENWPIDPFSWQDAGLFRVINTWLLAYVIGIAIRAKINIFTIKPIVFLGQHSLAVFCFHALLIYAFYPWMQTISGNANISFELAITTLFVASLWLPALLDAHYKRRVQ